MNLLDSIYYYHAEHGCWKPSYIISINKVQHRYILAGYGPHLPVNKVLAEDEYIKLVDTKQLESHTTNNKEVKA